MGTLGKGETFFKSTLFPEQVHVSGVFGGQALLAAVPLGTDGLQGGPGCQRLGEIHLFVVCACVELTFR